MRNNQLFLLFNKNYKKTIYLKQLNKQNLEELFWVVIGFLFPYYHYYNLIFNTILSFISILKPYLNKMNLIQHFELLILYIIIVSCSIIYIVKKVSNFIDNNEDMIYIFQINTFNKLNEIFNPCKYNLSDFYFLNLINNYFSWHDLF